MILVEFILWLFAAVVVLLWIVIGGVIAINWLGVHKERWRNDDWDWRK